MKRMTLKTRLVLLHTAMMTVVVCGVLAVLFSAGFREILTNVRGTLETRVSRSIEDVEYNNGRLEFDSELLALDNGVYLSVYEPDSPDLLYGRLPYGFTYDLPFSDGALRTVTAGDTEYCVLDIEFPVEGYHNLVLRGIVSVSDAERDFRYTLRLALILSPALVLLTAVCGYLLSRRALRPVAQITSTVRNIQKEKDLSKRVRLGAGSDEIYTLAQTFDSLLDTIETGIRREKQFASDVAHELRTPLAVVVMQCEELLAEKDLPPESRRSVEAIYRRVQAMAEMVSQLLLLSRADQGREKLCVEALDFSELSQLEAEEFSEIAAQRDIALEAEIEPGVTLEGDQTLLMRLWGNLLQNAVTYGRPGGHIRMAVRRDGDTVQLQVRDDGIGIAPEHLPRIWDRFYQVSASRSAESSGLGLSMVKWIVEAHHGEIRVESKEGAGTTFTARLPARLPGPAQSMRGETTMQTVEKWGVFEVSVHGPQDGNPFTERQFGAVFRGKSETVQVDGFYDGEGVYRVRFMPSFEGAYTYETRGNFPEAAGSGEFTVTAPAAGNHGPMRVVNQYHFAYEDGTPYYSVGTTCYAWAHQPEAVRQDTLRELDKGYFNKMRFCVFPKHYIHNFRDPETFPYEGTPVDNSGLNEETYSPAAGFSGNDWDFTRFNPEHFRRIERAIRELGDRGIEADIIVMHPYDRWGFSQMTKAQDDLYWNYVIARFAAYRNVWWSLANEYDLMRAKTLEDWERYAAILCAKDPYNHLRSIHNCIAFYDYTRPWITHCSMQRQDLYRHVEYTDEYRTRYGKPVVWDEIAYEGNIDMGWGNISGQELTRRFWEASLRGGYAGHGETFLDPENDILWWSHGGVLHGESPARIRFLHRILEETPGCGLKLGQSSFDETVGVPDCVSFGQDAGYEIHYYGFGRPAFRDFLKPAGEQWRAEVIDTWNMTVEDAGVHAGRFRIALPGREYIAVRLTRVKEESGAQNA